MGYDVVRVKIFTDAGTRVQIMIERQDGRSISVGDCESVSDCASALLDVEDVFDSRWNLEVSSPGLERPLVRPKDWERYAGHRVCVELNEPYEGRKKLQCTLRGLESDKVSLSLDSGKIAQIALSNIRSAGLVVTENMIRQALRMSKQEAPSNQSKRASGHVLH